MQATKRVLVFCLAVCMIIAAGCSSATSTSNDNTPDIQRNGCIHGRRAQRVSQ